MLTGIQEILTIGLIIVCLFFVPRFFRTDQSATGRTRKTKRLSGKMRLGIVISAILPITLAVALKPWENNMTIFISLGVLPVALGWAGFWVLSGFRNNS